MKRLSVFLAFSLLTASVSVIAQTTPKSAPKPAAKKECKKGDSCCSRDAKATTAVLKTPVKKS